LVVVDFGFQSGENAKCLSITLKAADVSGPEIQSGFAIVTKRRVTKVVGETGHVDQIGVYTKNRRQLPAHLGHF
jgi:hypothetical protein